jgi:hypothetical protein
MLGIATLAMNASTMNMNCAVTITPKASQRRGSDTEGAEETWVTIGSGKRDERSVGARADSMQS